ncbi:hypothetical protein [Hymenobacter cellulosilyticus]|uniref:DUF4258 domain-containing protein n=1 Tax=Hymenobacter cellulosilyticus TaxID=2932248 RepID=A0A8T9Q444_9BACT|nr:hypothetical protein [Hymenobacter cellulosilyticus]UOQ71825.1 hypothetical protein MUN79_25020 [Hymenobacter cellulosilyticus]
MKYVSLFFLLLLAFSGHAQQALPPLSIAQRFVAREGWPELPAYICCEVQQQAKRQTLGQQIPAHLRRTCEVVQQTDSTAVVAVELRDSTGATTFTCTL